MNTNKNSTINKIFNSAADKHQNNNLIEAQNLYMQVLQIDPYYVDANINLGVILQNTGNFEKAKIHYEKVIEVDPNNANIQANLGVIFKELGENQKAKICYLKAIEGNPNHPNAHNNLGVVFDELGEYQKAKNCFEKAIEITPNSASIYFNFGAVLQPLAENQKAIRCYEKAIEIDPTYVDAHNNLGIVFRELGEYQKAKSCYEKAIEIDPNYVHAHNNLGAVYKELGEHQKSISCYEKAIEINPDYVGVLSNISQVYSIKLNFNKAISTSYKALKIFNKKSTLINQSISLFKLKHDVQQAQYLISKNYEINEIDKFQKVGDEILSRKENKENQNNFDKKILLSPNEIDVILPYLRSSHIYKPKIISGSCINPNKNWQDIEDEYLNNTNQIIYIDDFLSDEALIELREFCLASKIWNREYNNKYLGAFSGEGFISPIHLQIVKDLKEKLPKSLGLSHLGEFWGFKYDSSLGKGINIHADFAFHNLNFWITPDEYNNDKNSGGLKVYDTPAPENWIFNEYNRNQDKVYEFLKENNANCIKIPYKFNRAVLFNSAYFHETDEIDFKDEYEGRRINCTYLFGNRLIK
mgnify:CR=1 FL=1